MTASTTTLTNLHGVGPIVTAYAVGYSGDINRFPNAGHDARYNATAPIEASSGPVIRHRLNPHGNQQLNHAIHMIAATQVRHDTPGRAYYLPSRPRDTAARKRCEPSNGGLPDALQGVSRAFEDAQIRTSQWSLRAGGAAVR